MLIATWNVNSVRSRQERLLAFLARHKPDVVCLQELKVPDDTFPTEAIAAAGYHAAVHGQKTYNGVAILSRKAGKDIVRGLGDGVDDPQARFIAATVEGVRVISVYVPNGSEVGSDKYAYKLAWMKRLRAWLDAHGDPKQPLVVCGDINVAPYDTDVARPDEWADTVLCHPDVRAAMDHVCAFGLVDVFHEKNPAGGVYSWWDYRGLGFQKNNGLRIDHILATRPLAERCTAARVDRDERKGVQPSDHAPVLADFSD